MYLQHYQLAQKPFQINTDPDFLWFGEKHKEALATLKYGVLDNKSFLLLTGDVGVGKTTVINALLQILEENDQVATVHNPELDRMDFFNHIAEAFGLPGHFETKRAFLTEFGKFLLQCYYKGRRVLLIIDECQLLNHKLLEEIRLLSNLEKNGEKLINIFFVGQLEFKDVLLQPENNAIRQRITVHYNIAPLTYPETEAYIDYRLKVAGARNKIFKKSAIREIYRYSKGYPRLINIVADRALLTGYIHSAKIIKKKTVKECARELELATADSRAQTQRPKKEKKAGDVAAPRVSVYRKLGFVFYPALALLVIYILYMVSDQMDLAAFALNVLSNG